MTKRFSLFLMTLLIGSLGIMFSCTEDDVIGGGGGAIGPNSSLVAGTDLVTTSATIGANGSFTVNLTASQGDVALNTLTIQKDGSNIDPSTVTINGTPAATAVRLLAAADRVRLDYTIVITTDLAGGESADYSFVISDESNLTSSESVSITAELLPPTLTATGGMGALVIPASTSFVVNLSGVAGSSSLATLSILENDLAIDPSRIEITGLTVMDNPFTIPTENDSGFEWEIFVRGADTAITSTYRWVLEDSSGSTAEVTRDIITENPGTPVESIKTELSLLNQAGPAGTGGIDLFTGESTGSDDAMAHLVDRGIDLDLPMASNWLQQIGPGMATTTLKTITAIQPEGFSFENVDTKEAIEAAFDLETNVIADSESSDVIAPGDMFVLQGNGGTFILVRIDEVMVTADDNDDKYILSAKF